jgi:hypothetical protein
MCLLIISLLTVFLKMSKDYIQAVKDVLDFINGDGYDKDIYYIAHKLDMFIRNPEKYKF